MPKFEVNNHEWSYTRRAEDEFGLTYMDRKLIGRDSDVRGGVYYGTYQGEAIVVDPTKYPKLYDLYYSESTQRASSNGIIQRPKVLEAVFNTVRAEMPYSQRGVDQTLKDIAKRNGVDAFRDGGKVELSVFMAAGVGVCRHQALACAVMLEKFKDEGHIRGDISVDRNIRWDPIGGKSDGHAWVRYTSYSGNIMILDVAQDYFGFLNDSSSDVHWNYMRPDEQQLAIAPKLGQFGLDVSQNNPPLVFHV